MIHTDGKRTIANAPTAQPKPEPLRSFLGFPAEQPQLSRAERRSVSRALARRESLRRFGGR